METLGGAQELYIPYHLRRNRTLTWPDYLIPPRPPAGILGGDLTSAKHSLVMVGSGVGREQAASEGHFRNWVLDTKAAGVLRLQERSGCVMRFGAPLTGCHC